MEIGQEQIKQKSDTIKIEKDVKPHRCPICGVDTTFVHRVKETKINQTADWYQCQCGIIFQDELPTHNIYNEEYVLNYVGSKEYNLQAPHAARVYANLIEECTYGRMLLDVGFNTDDVMKFFEKRGWITWGIDCNKHLKGGGNLYKGNFETYDFSIDVSSDKMKVLLGDAEVKRTFDLIWMSHVLEHFNDPIKALKKAYDLLSSSGLIYVAVPDIDFIYKTGTPGFPHWKKQEHYIMWTERALCRELESIGFNIIAKRRNFSSRFVAWYDVQVLAQKRWF
jgi:SAM-dependent methyltransferase